MPGNQMTNVQRALFLNALRDAWPHILKNPSDLHSTVSDILNRLNIKRTLSRSTLRRYVAELGLGKLPRIVTREAQIAAAARARAGKILKPTTPPTPAPDYTTVLTQINDSLINLRQSIHSQANSLALQLDAIRIALEPSRKENT